jgi:CHAT domain-containing protein
MRRPGVPRVRQALWACAFFFAQGFGSLWAEEPIPITTDHTLSTSHSADERFAYHLNADADEVYLIQVDQHGLDFIVSVEDPAGTTRSFNSPLFRDEHEIILLEDTQNGVYEITVYSDEFTGAQGTHSITVTSLASVPDPQIINGWRLMSQGAEANYQAGVVAWTNSYDSYLAAADLWSELGRFREQSHALYSAGYLAYWRIYNWEHAEQLALNAATSYAELNQQALFANASALQAMAKIERAIETEDAQAEGIPVEAGKLFKEALQQLSKAQAAHEQLGNLYDAGQVTAKIGVAYLYMGGKGDLSTARDRFEQAVTLFRGIDEWSAEIDALSNIGVLDFQEGYLVNAADTFQSIIESLPKQGSEVQRAWVIDNLAEIHSHLGNFDDSLRNYQLALSLHRAIEDQHGEAESLLGLGQAYVGIGEFDLATTYLNESLRLSQEIHNGGNREAALRHLGNIEYLRGDYAAALSYHQRALSVAISMRYRNQLHSLLARDLNALGRFDEAAAMAVEALAYAEQADSDYLKANALLEGGRISIQLNDMEVADQQLSTALTIYQSLGLPIQEAEAFLGLAHAARARDDLIAAVSYGEQSLEKIETLRGNIANPELQAFYSATRRTYYDTQISLLMAMYKEGGVGGGGFLHDALTTSERGRARMLVELLNEASVDLRAAADGETSQRHHNILNHLAELRYQRDKLIAEPGGDKTLDDTLSGIVSAMAESEHELNLIETELRLSSPDFASLAEPRILTAPEIQALLDDDTTLLEYALGDEQSFVWVVSRDRTFGVELAGKDEIETAARKVFEQLRIYRTDAESLGKTEQSLQNLADLVLAPVEELLHGRRLVIAADGALQYIPFGVLPNRLKDDQQLLQAYDIINVPSISAIAAQRARPATISPGPTLLVVADPVFTADDRRFDLDSHRPTSSPVNGGPVERHASYIDSLDRLVYTGQEAAVIAALVPESSRKLMTGFDANRNMLLETDLHQFRYIHFATHGLVDSRYPALSALALSRYSREGQPQEALLRLSDIYDLRLNAELVVLSSCDTALGRDIRGEGLVGLTQGFLYAGARSLVVSLWQVPDRATSELMSHFYRILLQDGLGPAEALRRAQLEIASKPRWKDPYFWASMVFVGEWQ